ncbi:MAG: hypothetical protein MR270_02705, partial [Erysipelotrichaceae bacterium]|nr:hypothetical protein [Erysipelotrichaceae bacterium]
STYAYKKYKNEPYLEVTSNFNIGESNGGYIRDIVISTNCDFVKMYHNNQLVQTFTIDDYQRNGTFKVKDLIGDLLINKHGLSVDRSNYLKQIIEEVLKYDGIISDKIIAKYGKDDVNEAWNYYGKYVSNWGSKVTPYYFEGYKNNKKVVSLYKGPQYLSHINVTLSTNTLISSDTYDVCKVSLQAIGNLNNRVDYAFNAFKVETSNNLEIMGNKYMALIAGSYSFYVRNLKDEGEAWIKICFDNAKDLLIKLEIRKDENKQYEKISKYCNSSSYVIRMHK